MIGGDLKVADYRFRARTQKTDFVLFPNDASRSHITMFTSIMLLCKIGIATDPFTIFPVFNCGIIQTLLICIGAMILVQLSIHLYMRCWFYGTAYNYPDIWVCVFGSTLKFIPILLNILSYTNKVIYHGYEIYNNALLFLVEMWTDPPGFVTNKWFLTYVICLLTALPCLLVKKFISLSWVAILGNVCNLISLVCVIVALIRNTNDYGFDPSKQIRYFSSDYVTSFRCVSEYFTAYFTQPMLDLVFSDMSFPTVGRCLSCTWITSAISAAFHYGVGLCGYFCFARGDEQNIFFNLPKRDVEVIIGQIATYIVTLTSNAIYTYFLATQVSTLIVERRNDESAPVFISGIVVIMFYVGMNFIGDISMEIFDLISIIAFIILVYLLPSIFYLKLYKFTQPFWGIISILLVLIGIPICVCIIYFEVTSSLLN